MSGGIAFLIEQPRTESDMRCDVIDGLSQAQKSIPPKYFYDAHGAELFVEITETPEYYPTRTEYSLLSEIAPDVAGWAGSGASMIEPGSGAAEKARVLLGAFDQPHEYCLFDISSDQLKRAGADIAAGFPGLRVGAVAGDFTAAMPRASDVFTGEGKRICFFPGSTLGNFSPEQQAGLLRSFKTPLRTGDAILLGVDGVKDTARLDAAYNDAAGLTAAFNLNLLQRLKSDLGAKLELSDFEHLSFYNPALQRIEMHLVAPRGSRIEIDDHVFEFKPGETIHTENSWKFDRARIEALADETGLAVTRLWQAKPYTFYLCLLEVR